MKKLLPIILLLLGTGAGVGAGVLLRPEPSILADATSKLNNEPVSQTVGKKELEAPDNAAKLGSSDQEAEYIKLSNQFVIPIVKKGKVISLVVLALSLEIPSGMKEAVFRREPKIRDSFLQVLFDHANIGGFDGEFTEAGMLDLLRGALREIAQRDLGSDLVSDVLILEIARQDY